METVHTVRIRPDWLEGAIRAEGGPGRLAEKLGVTPSTISRVARRQSESSPRFIGAVLATYPIHFQDAFDVVEERVRPRRARYVKQVDATAA